MKKETEEKINLLKLTYLNNRLKYLKDTNAYQIVIDYVKEKRNKVIDKFIGKTS